MPNRKTIQCADTVQGCRKITLSMPYYRGVIWASRCLKSQANLLLVHQITVKNIEAPDHLVDSPHKESLRRTWYQYHDVIMQTPSTKFVRLSTVITYSKAYHMLQIETECKKNGCCNPLETLSTLLHTLYLWHDDVIKWNHFPRYWPFVRGIHRSRWIPHTKASDAELWCFLWSASK